ncbi:MAG: CPBP family intramembrane metalloprotease [Bacteroidales bacterium]|nr:CPBP family intramembrane metalloprotease [Bacteroidales bacterium]
MKFVEKQRTKKEKRGKRNIFQTSFSDFSNLDFKVVSIIIFSVISLILIKYFGNLHNAADLLKTAGVDNLDQYRNFVVKNQDIKYVEKIYWSSINIFFFIFLPIVLIVFVFKQSVLDYGFRNFLKINRTSLKYYFFFLAIVIPLVFIVSQNEAFQKKYPFYTPSGDDLLWPKFYIWQFFYFLQFVALEFFFRGFILHGLKKTFGYYSIFIMLIPYVMIHFQKPLPETFGAIFAGIALGYLSLRNGSIALGIVLHYSVALCMDILSLYNKGYL